MSAARFVVAGRVQGVGFRWWVRTRARELGITGRVRNRDDGTVEVVAAGSKDAVDRLREDLATGPPEASVQEVSVSPLENLTYNSFEIAP